MGPVEPSAEQSVGSTSIHSIEFMATKHKADLLYLEKEYRAASELYQEMQGVVPSSNTCVVREIRDSLTRCYLRLGEAKLARQEAQELVRTYTIM